MKGTFGAGLVRFQLTSQTPARPSAARRRARPGSRNAAPIHRAIRPIVDPSPVTQQAYLERAQRKLGDELRVVRVPVRVFMGLAWGVEQLGKLLKREVPLTRYRVRSLRPLANFDLAAANNELGWTPRVGVERGLQQTFGA